MKANVVLGSLVLAALCGVATDTGLMGGTQTRGRVARNASIRAVKMQPPPLTVKETAGQGLCCGLSTGECVRRTTTGATGVVACCDSDDPQLPLLISWDGRTDLGGCEQCIFCDIGTGNCCDASGSYSWVPCIWIEPCVSDQCDFQDAFGAYADSYFDNTVDIRFAFSDDPGQVSFALEPACGSLDPVITPPVFEPPCYAAYTTYSPCETEGITVSVRATPAVGDQRTATVSLLPRIDISCGDQQNMCISTFDVNTGEPAPSEVCAEVIPPECGSVDPQCGISQLDPPSGTYIFCSTYTAGECTQRVRARLLTINDPEDPEDDESLYFSFDQECCLPDEYESPGDNDPSGATPIRDGQTQKHSIIPPDDQDWFSFTLACDSGVVIETSGESGDTRMWLHDEELAQIDFSDDEGDGLFSRIERTCATDPLPAGVYFVKVDEYGNNNEICSYDVTLLINSCETTRFDSVPACDGILPRITNNCIHLLFGSPIEQPRSGDIEIRELLSDGGFGEDLSDRFTFTVEPGNMLTIEENGRVLSNQTWYAVRNTGNWNGVCDFQANYVVVFGDVNRDGWTNAFDVNDIWNRRSDEAEPCIRFDINADGRINAFDVNDAWMHRNSKAPDKPAGHDTCSQ